MASFSDKRWGFVKDYVRKEDVKFMGEAGPMNNFKLTKKADRKNVYTKLKTWTGMNVYKKEEIPEHLHYRNNKNILDILLVSKGKDMVMTTFSGEKRFIGG